MLEAEAKILFREALECFRRREFSRAIEIWGQLQQAGMTLHNQDLYLAVARREQARVLQVREDFGPNLENAVGGEAGKLLAQGCYIEAVPVLEALLSSGGEQLAFSLHLALAQLELLLGHYQDSLFHLEQARLLEAHSSLLYACFGAVLRELERPLEAERDYRQAVDLDQENGAAWYGLARLYFEDGRYDLAESCLQRVLLKRPGALHAMGLLDKVRRKQDHSRSLIKEALEILEAHPDYPDWHHRIAVHYSFTGQYQKAREHLRRALELNPQLAKSAYQLGMLEAQTGSYHAACEAFKTCLAHGEDPQSPELEVARRLEEEGKLSEAAYEYSVAVAPPENRAGRHIQMGKRLFADNFLPQARRELERAILLQPSYPDAHFVLGRVAAAEKQHTEARLCFKKALELSPHYQAAALGLAQEELVAGNVGACRELLGQYGVSPRPDLVAGWGEVLEGVKRAGG
jgi:tetratricopeptide (TPR) repeat protein